MTTLEAPAPDTRSVIRSTAATTAFVVGWYALPDYVRSMPVRSVLKIVGLTTFSVLGVRELRRQGSWEEMTAALRGVSAGPADSPAGSADSVTASHVEGSEQVEDADQGSAQGPAQGAALAGAAVVVGGSAVLTVAVEKLIFRRNEARASAGARLPHTRSALLFGALTALIAVPDILRSRR